MLELRRELAGERDGFRITLDASELQRCDKLLCTSTVLLNDALANCRHARAIALIGPGAACLPDALFVRGVTVLGGAWIDDAGGFTRAIARDGWPGAAELARRARLGSSR